MKSAEVYEPLPWPTDAVPSVTPLSVKVMVPVAVDGEMYARSVTPEEMVDGVGETERDTNDVIFFR